MRVIHLAQYEGPYGGSFIAMLRAVLARARSEGCSVEAVFSDTAPGKPWLADVEADGVPVRFAGGNRRDHARVIADLLAEQPDEPTVLHTHFTAFDLAAVQAARSHPRTAVFWHLHTPAATTLRYQLQNRVKFGVLGRSVAGIFAVGPHMAERVAKMAPAGKVHHLHNALDVAAFRPASASERAEARERLGVPAEGIGLLHFGWNWDIKGGDLFLDVLERIRVRHPSAFGIARSNAPEAPGAIAARGLDDHVHLITDVDRVQTLFAAADVTVATSRFEGMNFTAFESLCSGVAVVASDIAGHAAAGRMSGVTLAPREPEAFTDALDVTLRLDPEQVARETAASRRELEDTLSLDRWSGELMAAYHRALGV